MAEATVTQNTIIGLTELLSLLRKLNRSEKLHVMQFLVSELAQEEEEGLLISGMSYPVWSPYDAFEAADTMLKVLKADQAHETE